MAIELAKAYVQVIPTTNGIKSKIAEEMAPEIEKAGDSSGKKFGASLLSGAAGIIGAGTAAIGAAATAVWAAASNTAAAADNIDKMSQKIGISTTAYQEWAFVMEHSGTSVDNLQSSMKTLSGVIVDATAGSDTATEKLLALGLSVEELGAMSQEQQLSTVIAALQDMEQGADRTTAATDLLGKSAVDMGALLNMSAEDTAALKQQLHDLGGVMDEDAVAAGAAFEDSLLNLQTAVKGIGNSMLAEFLPAMNTVMDGLALIFSGDDGGMALVQDGIQSFFDTISNMLPGVIDSGIQLVSAFLDVLIDNLPQIVTMGIRLIGQLAVGIISAIPHLVGKLPEVLSALLKGLGEWIPAIMEVGVNLVKGLWEGILSAKDWLANKIKGWAGGVVDTLKDFFGIHSPSTLTRDLIGRNLAAGVAVGIADNAYLVDEAMEDMTSGLTATAKATVQASASLQSGTLSARVSGDTSPAIYGLLAQYLPALANMRVVLDDGTIVGVMDARLGSMLRREALA